MGEYKWSCTTPTIGEVFPAGGVPKSSEENRSRQSFRNPFNHPVAVIRFEVDLEMGGYKRMPFFE